MPSRLKSLLFLLGLAGTSATAEPFPADSPEHQALTAAAPALTDTAFTLREDYWNGILTTATGRAVKLQLFKRNVYGLFLGVAPSSLPPGAKLHLHIFDSDNTEVATAVSKAGEAAVALNFENTLKSGLFLILMRVEMPPGPLAASDIPAAMFYGWK